MGRRTATPRHRTNANMRFRRSGQLNRLQERLGSVVGAGVRSRSARVARFRFSDEVPPLSSLSVTPSTPSPSMASGTAYSITSIPDDHASSDRWLSTFRATPSRLLFTVFTCQMPLFLVGTSLRVSSSAILRSDNPLALNCRARLMTACWSGSLTRCRSITK